MRYKLVEKADNFPKLGNRIFEAQVGKCRKTPTNWGKNHKRYCTFKLKRVPKSCVGFCDWIVNYDTMVQNKNGSWYIGDEDYWVKFVK